MFLHRPTVHSCPCGVYIRAYDLRGLKRNVLTQQDVPLLPGRSELPSASSQLPIAMPHSGLSKRQMCDATGVPTQRKGALRDWHADV